MKKAVPLSAVLLLLFQLTAAGQTSPALQINNSYPVAALSWTGGSAPLFSLQTTTNLSPPVVWTDLAGVAGTGNFNVLMANPQQFFRLAQITPIFQFAIFYNLDLEINAAQTFVIVGPVFSNGGLWSDSIFITFSNTVSAVGIATNGLNDPFCSSYVGSGPSHYSLAGQPISGAAPLALTGFGTNISTAVTRSVLNLPPPAYAMGTPAAYSVTGSVYLANDVDLYLTNFSNGTNWGSITPKGTNMALYFQDTALHFISYDFYLLKTGGSTNNVTMDQLTNVWYAGYSFATNAVFYDWREGWNAGSGPPKTVQAVQIDLTKFNIWLTNRVGTNDGWLYNNICKSEKAHPIDSIYVYNSVPLTSTNLPAVRVVNGGMLPLQTAPYGFTVVTPMPMYVYGNYNVSNSFGSSLGQNSTTYTWPAALMADAITVLSSNWNDGVTTKLPAAITTTVNAACLAGIVPSTNTMYSGGVENFLRTLENWSSSSLWYNGSIVAMFPSEYATNNWQQTGGYYNAPNRRFAYDTNFVRQTHLPPLTPTVLNHVTP